MQRTPAAGVDHYRAARVGTRAAMTLFEVAISLAVLAFAVVSILLVFPTGLKTQQLARFQLFAAVKAEEMIASFNQNHDFYNCIDAETYSMPWETTISRRPQAPDLETCVCNSMNGIMPIPTTIARRLDSDNDEIQHIVADGGSLYYAQPMATSQVFERLLGDNVVANETQRMVIAVTGYAQDNAIPIFPWKAWPYYYPYPSPPMHAEHEQDGTTDLYSPYGYVNYYYYCWEITNDPDLQPVFDLGYKPYGIDYTLLGPPVGPPPTLAKATAYVQTALWYCSKKGLLSWIAASGASPQNFSTLPAGVAPATAVNAMRILAHATTVLTAWYNSTTLSTGVAIASTTINGFASPAATITHAKILWYHETCMNLAMFFAASFPYDWGSPRPMQRAQMMDFPLIEYDLIPSATYPLLSGTIAATGIAAQQWRPVASSPIKHLGRSLSYPNISIPSQDSADPAYQPNPALSIWGDSANFTLAKPFKPAERCRELVFWSVGWQDYVDFETAPSAAVDAGRFQLACTDPWVGTDFVTRMDYLLGSTFAMNCYRNPERNLTFTQDVSARATGASISDSLIGTTAIAYAAPDRGSLPAAKSIFVGRYGADRNFNHRLDRGPLPTSVRLHATLVARFAFYDPRVPHEVR